MNVENLQKLYEVGQRILQRRLPFGFGEWECGTYACWSGWYGRIHGLDPADAYFGRWRLFGINDATRDQLFERACDIYEKPNHPADRPGPEAYAELERRMEYLADLIRKAGGTVPGERPALPDSVTRIFETEAA